MVRSAVSRDDGEPEFQEGRELDQPLGQLLANLPPIRDLAEIGKRRDPHWQRHQYPFGGNVPFAPAQNKNEIVAVLATGSKLRPPTRMGFVVSATYIG